MSQNRYKCSLLAVDDDPEVLAILVRQLGHEFEILTVGSGQEARQLLASRTIDIILTDLQLKDESGLSLLDHVYRTAPRTARVLITGMACVQDAVDAINCCHVHRLILKPWRSEDLAANLRAVSRNLLLERSHENLLEQLRTLNAELEARVEERTHDLQVMNQILEKMALTDPLTGLPNRRSIELLARKELLRRSRCADPIAIGLIDIDRFKSINSLHTLTGGDHVLVTLAKVLQQTVRVTDTVGRVGGEEFMVVAPSTDLAGADVLAERIRSAVQEAEMEFEGSAIRITISAGLVVIDDARLATYEDLREQAAKALAQAKTDGRNRCIVKRFPQATAVPAQTA
jgi:diguanylate cyclase (GGDEF)-like protein